MIIQTLNLNNIYIAYEEGKGDSIIKIDEDIIFSGNTLDDLIDWVYPNLEENMQDVEWLRQRAILCPKMWR